MKAFRFHLERVLQWRSSQFTVEGAKLDQLRVELQLVLREQVEIETRRDEFQSATARLPVVCGRDLAAVEQVRLWTLTEAKRLTEHAARLRRAIEVQQQAVVEAQRRVRLLERLKERHRTAWKAGCDRELDELAAESAIAGWRRMHAMVTASE